MSPPRGPVPIPVSCSPTLFSVSRASCAASRAGSALARSVSHAFCFSVTFWKEAGRERWVQAAGLGGAWGSSLPVTLTSPPPPASRPLDPQVTRSPGDSGMGTALSTGSSLPAGGGLGPRRQPWPQGATGSWSVSACSSASPRESVSVCSHAHMHSSTCASVHAPMHASVHSSEPLGAKQRPAAAWCLSERSSFCVVTGTKGLWAWRLCWAPGGGTAWKGPRKSHPRQGGGAPGSSRSTPGCRDDVGLGERGVGGADRPAALGGTHAPFPGAPRGGRGAGTQTSDH